MSSPKLCYLCAQKSTNYVDRYGVPICPACKERFINKPDKEERKEPPESASLTDESLYEKDGYFFTREEVERELDAIEKEQTGD